MLRRATLRAFDGEIGGSDCERWRHVPSARGLAVAGGWMQAHVSARGALGAPSPDDERPRVSIAHARARPSGDLPD